MARHREPTARPLPFYRHGAVRVTDRLLSANEVAEWPAVPVTWVRESTRSGAMPHVELGRYRRYRQADVARWLDECSRPGRPIAFRRVGGRVA